MYKQDRTEQPGFVSDFAQGGSAASKPDAVYVF